MAAWRRAASSSMSVVGGMGPWITAETNGREARGAMRERTEGRKDGKTEGGQAVRSCPDATLRLSVLPSFCLVPPDRLLVQVDEDLLGLEILLHPPVAQFAAEAGG